MIVFNNRKISIKLLLIIIISVIIFYSFYIFNSEKRMKNIGIIRTLNLGGTSHFFKYTIDQTIPGISLINDTVETTSNNFDILELILAYELPIFESTTYIEEFPEERQETLAANDSALNTDESVEHAQTDLTTEVIESIVPNSFTDDFEGTQIKNGTNLELTDDIYDTSTLDINKSDVIIFHTHTCESYTPTENYPYEESGTFRTLDLNCTVVGVGNYLNTQLTSYGFNVFHDTTYHDYPAYSGSYGRSQATVENLLVSHPGTDIIIDLHRDAIADTTYAPSVKIGDEIVSQLMFVIGTNAGGLEHPNWKQNLKFAVAVQKKANELYPGLFRPILISESRYNQQLGKAACIIEVGATGNTLEQSMASMKYLALVLNEVLHN